MLNADMVRGRPQPQWSTWEYRGCMAKVSVKGMVIGGLTDIIATVVLTIPLVIYVIMDQLHAATKQPLEVAVTAALYASPILYGLQSLMSLGCSILGGYVAARVANHD